MKSIPLSFRQMEYVLAVATTGSTAAASRLLNISQPSISLAIARCEEIFEQKLFVRITGQGMEMTAFGARKVAELRALEKQARAVLSGNDALAARMDLGVFSTLGPRYGPQLVRSFTHCVPSADVHLHEGDLRSLFAWLLEGRIDLALIYDFGAPRDLEIVALRDVVPYVVFPREHYLSQQTDVLVEDLQDEPMILMNLPHSRCYFLSLLQTNEQEINLAYETQSVEMLRSMVANGFGIGLLATDTCSDTAYDGMPLATATLVGQLPTHRIALAKSRQLPSRPVVESFISHAKDFFDTP